MKVSEQGKDFIKSWEKCRLTAYLDSVGVWTIGWGRTTMVHKGDTCTQEQADEWFEEEIDAFANKVQALIYGEVCQNEFDALCSLAYNIGVAALGRSTLMKKLNQKDYLGAAEQFLVWNKGTVNGTLTVIAGLTNRRKSERKILKEAEYEMHD